jgi:hypothetical protein
MGHWVGTYTLGMIESNDRVFEYYSWHRFISETSCAWVYIRIQDWLVWT